MTLPAALQAALSDGETVLWHSPAQPSARLADYGGAHEWLGRLFFALSSVTALIFFLGMQDAGRLSVSAPLLFWVGGPVVAGLVIRQIGRRHARRAAQARVYAVTTKRVLAVGHPAQDGYAINPGTIAAIALEAADRDVLEYSDENSGAVPPYVMHLPKGEAAKAQAAIEHAKAGL